MDDLKKLSKKELAEQLAASLACLADSEESSEIQRLAHDLQTHQIELEMQNRELRESQFKLEESHNSYADLYDFAPVGYMSLDEQGIIHRINLTAAIKLGQERAHIIGKPFTNFLEHDEKLEFFNHLRLEFQSSAANKKRAYFHFKHKNTDGEVRDLEIFSGPVGLSQSPYLLSVIYDITERKQAEEELRIERDFAEGLIETAPTIVLVLDTEGRIVRFNPYMEEITGYSLKEVTGQDWFENFLPQGDRNKVRELFNTAINGKQTRGNVNSILTRNGEQREIEWYDTTLSDSFGNVIGLLSVGQDITERRKLYEQLQLSAMVMDNTPEGIMIVDNDLHIVKVNPAFVHTTGYSEEEIIGKKPGILSSNRHDESFYDEMWKTIKLNDHWQGEIWNRRKDGDIYPEWLLINAIRNEEGNVTHYVGIFSDISTQEHIRKRLHSLAYYDALTDLPNRELFKDRLKNSLAQAKREEGKVALMFLDLDNFKKINDTLGHRAGDSLLKEVAHMLKECVRDSDTVARLGGDEFTIIMPGVRHVEGVAKMAEKILRTMEIPMHTEDGHDIYAGTSIGISLYPDDGNDVDTLLKNADTAMYRAKAAGRKNFMFYTREMSEYFAERLLMENELRKAIENEVLTLAYQPQVEIESGRVTGFEVLARWHHAQKGWISPVQFITIAEETGLILPIGEWVLRQACMQLKQWQEQFSPELKIAVNLSGHQVHQKGLVDKILSAIKASGIPVHTLELELTESSLMDNIDSTINTLSELNNHGIQLAIDDFGTGYSSLSYLKRFDIHKLKIDQSFVRDITTDKDDAEIVTTIIAMAKNLSLNVIAEGVETREQLDYLWEKGCNEVQGTYFCSPKSAEEITAMLEASDRIMPANK